MTPPVEKERAAITPAHDFALAFGLECEKASRTPEGLAWLISIVEARDEQIRQASRAELSKGEQSEWTHEPPSEPGWYWIRTRTSVQREWDGARIVQCDRPATITPELIQWWPIPIDLPDTQRALAEQREENQRLRETLRSLDLTCNFGWTNKAFTCETSENDPSTWCARCKARAALSPTNGRKS